MASALAAMQAADARMLFMPVEEMARVVDGQRFIQDALRAQIEYQASGGGVPVVTTGPTQYGTGGGPKVTLGGVASVRGWLGNQAAQFDGYGAQVSDQNPPFWGFVCAQIGTDTDVRVLVNFNTGHSGYGDVLLISADEGLQVRIGGTQVLPFAGPEPTPAAMHIYSWRHDPLADTLRFYRDGIQTFVYTLAATYPDAHFLGGFAQLGGRAAATNIEPHDGANAACGVVCAGNGLLSDTGHTTILDWLKGLYGIA
jgi:hypothetical protein